MCSGNKFHSRGAAVANALAPPPTSFGQWLKSLGALDDHRPVRSPNNDTRCIFHQSSAKDLSAWYRKYCQQDFLLDVEALKPWTPEFISNAVLWFVLIFAGFRIVHLSPGSLRFPQKDFAFIMTRPWGIYLKWCRESVYLWIATFCKGKASSSLQSHSLIPSSCISHTFICLSFTDNDSVVMLTSVLGESPDSFLADLVSTSSKA